MITDINSIKENIRSIFCSLDQHVGTDYLSDYLDVPKRKINSLKNIGESDTLTFFSTLNKLHINYHRILSGSYDINYVLSLLLSESFIPSSYEKASFTTRNISRNILAYLENKFGTEFKSDCLDYMLTTENIFTQNTSDDYINTQWSGDLLQYLHRNKRISTQGLYLIGLKSGFFYENTSFAQRFKGLNGKQAYGKLLEEVFRHIDKTFDYEFITCTETVTKIRKRFSNQVLDELKISSYSTRETCINSTGFGASILYLATGEFATGFHTKCLFHGDPYCEFVFRYDKQHLMQPASVYLS